MTVPIRGPCFGCIHKYRRMKMAFGNIGGVPLCGTRAAEVGR